MNIKMSPEKKSLVSLSCLRCRLRQNLCVCDLMPHFDLKTRIVLLMQCREYKVSSGTGHLIPKILPHSEIRFRGMSNKIELSTQGLSDNTRETFLLFPDPGAQVLDEAFVRNRTKPVTLIVPDGNWRQASKMVRRIEGLRRFPKVILPLGPPSTYRLRRGQRENGVCTFEAVSRALGILEGKEVQEQMDYFFRVMVERVLWMRGKLKAQEVFGGLGSS